MAQLQGTGDVVKCVIRNFCKNLYCKLLG